MAYKVKDSESCRYCGNPTQNRERATNRPLCIDCAVLNASMYMRFMRAHKYQGIEGQLKARDEWLAWREARITGAPQGNQEYEQLSMLDD